MLNRRGWTAPYEDCEPRLHPVALGLIVLTLSGAFAVSEMDWLASTYENYNAEAEDAEQLVAGGRSDRKVAYATIAALGIVAICWPTRRQINYRSLPFLLLMTYVAICVSSVAWSDDPWLTIKRSATLLFCLLGVLGLAKHLTVRDLNHVAISVGLLLLSLSLFAELSQATFRPWLGEYRFAGVFHPNTQASYCALIVISSFFGMKMTSRGKFIYFVILLVGLSLLALTKSRTSIAGAMLGVTAAWYIGAARAKKVLVALGAPLAIIGSLLIALLLDVDVTGQLSTASQLGRGAETDLVQLNGRLPLWSSMFEYISESPLLGYGYHGFWTPDRIAEISLEQEWTVPTAHSAYFDVLLSVGICGGFFFGLAVLLATRRAAHNSLTSRAPTDGYLLSLIFFALATSLFESGYAQPVSFDSFIVGCGLMRVALQPRFAAAASRLDRHLAAHVPRLAGGLS